MLSSPILINDQNDEYKEYDWNNLNYSDFDGNSSVIVSGFGLPQLPKLDLSKLTTDECISIGWIDNGWIEETSNLLNDEIIKKVSRLCLTSGHSKTRVMNKDKFLLDEASAAFAAILKQKLGGRVLGPEYPVVGRINSYFLKHILIKLEKEISPSVIKKDILKDIITLRKTELFKQVRIALDVDPG
jgi:hypothetical protein